MFAETRPDGQHVSSINKKVQCLFGSFHSAGGIGVILNLDRLAQRLKMAGLKVHVRGLADSGWYLDIPACQGDSKNCLPAQENNIIKQGMA